MAFVSTPVLSSSTSSFLSRNVSVCKTARPVSLAPRMSSGVPPLSFDNVEPPSQPLQGLVFTPETENNWMTRVKINYNDDQISAINNHINVEYTASYTYHAIWAYFNRDYVNLPGFAKYFNEQSKEERDHAHEFMEYQNKRGGMVKLHPIAVPELSFSFKDGTTDVMYAMELHLQLEKFVMQKLQLLQQVAEEVGDSQMMDFVDHYMTHQVDAIKHAADLVGQLKRDGTTYAVIQMDHVLRGEC